MHNVAWSEGTGENTGLQDQQFSLVTFGSSFNVVDRKQTLAEVKRIAKPKAWFACMWNHRDIDDPIQKAVEDIIAKHIDGYQYGLRRENQSEFLVATKLFNQVDVIEEKILHDVSVNDWLEAWRSHATLQRQAGKNFHPIIDNIEKYIKNLNKNSISIPYTTRVWVAQFTD
jgi:hypothetical protein